MKYTLENIAHTFNKTIILGEDNWKALTLSLMSAYAPRILVSGIEIRSNLHVLFAGDISSAKSQTLNVIKKVAPKWELISKATEASMEGSAVNKNIKKGVLERASEGIIVIPEFQTAYYGHMQILREALDCGEIRVFKKGQTRIYTPNTTVLSACNPTDDFFLEGMGLREQVKFKEGLLSRFDILIPTLSTPEMSQRVVDGAVLFGKSPTGVKWNSLKSFFKRKRASMKKVKAVHIDESYEQQLKEVFRDQNKRTLATRPFVILRDLETLLRLVNAVTVFETKSTGVAKVTEEAVECGIELWEHILNLRAEFYKKNKRDIQTIPEHIIQLLQKQGGTAKVEDLKEEIVVKQSLCSEPTFYRKVKDLREHGEVKHTKGHGATLEITASTSFKED